MGEVKQFEGVYELFMESPRRQVNGDKLQLVLEKPFTESEQKELVDFFDKTVQVKIGEYVEEGNKQSTSAVVDGIFTITSTNPRRLSNGNKTRFILEKLYDKESHRQVVELFQKDVKVFMEIIKQELPFEEDDSEEEGVIEREL